MGNSITYPDGTTLSSTALTLAQINAALQPIICWVLGITDPTTTYQVRIEYPTQGAPFQDINDDVCYIRCNPKDDPYDRIRDRQNLGTATFPFPLGQGNPDATNEQWTYTRAWAIHITFYGPNSLDDARAVRSALYQNILCDMLAQVQLFPVSDFPEAIRNPEEMNGQWFERCDLEFEAYEFITENIVRQTVVSVEVIVEEAQGIIADLTVKTT